MNSSSKPRKTPAEWHEENRTIPEEAFYRNGTLRVPWQLGEKYVADYRKGWKDRTWGLVLIPGDLSAMVKDGDAYEDGYLDRANRDDQKWHLAWCTDHDNRVDGGCGKA